MQKDFIPPKFSRDGLKFLYWYIIGEELRNGTDTELDCFKLFEQFNEYTLHSIIEHGLNTETIVYTDVYKDVFLTRKEKWKQLI